MKPGPFGIVRKPVSSAENTSSTQASMLACTSSNVRSKGNGMTAPLMLLNRSHRRNDWRSFGGRGAQFLDDGIEITQRSHGLSKAREFLPGSTLGLPLAMQVPDCHADGVPEGNAA